LTTHRKSLAALSCWFCDSSVPYDHYLPFVFQGEEILQAIRGFTFGYDSYAPVRSVAFHIYGMKDNIEKRKNIHIFNENEVLFGPGVKNQACKLKVLKQLTR
jgi:hypothetical protein